MATDDQRDQLLRDAGFRYEEHLDVWLNREKQSIIAGDRVRDAPPDWVRRWLDRWVG
jgi:hypothetical protein